MLSSSLDTLLKVSKTTSPQKLFAYDYITLYPQIAVGGKVMYKVINIVHQLPMIYWFDQLIIAPNQGKYVNNTQSLNIVLYKVRTLQPLY